MALGTVEVQGDDGVTRQVICYNSEQDVPSNWRDEAGGTNLAFTNPDPNGGMTTDPAIARPGVDGSLVYDVIGWVSTVQSAEMVTYRVVVPAISGQQPLKWSGGDRIDLEPITAILIIGILVTAIVGLMVLNNFLGGRNEVAAAVANGGKIQSTTYTDVDGDGAPDIEHQTYNNGQVVSTPITQAGVDYMGTAEPTITVDPSYDPSDILDIFNAGFTSQLKQIVTYGVVGGVILGLVYMGGQLYSSYKHDKPFEAPAIESIASGARSLGRGAGKAVGRI